MALFTYQKLENNKMATDEVTPQVEVTEQKPPAQVTEVDEVLGKDGKPFDPARAQALIEKLTKENKELKPKAQLADELTAKEKEKADAELTEVERLKNQLAEQEKNNRSTMAENAALAAGLPANFADRLKGTTKAELEADAAEFAKLFPDKVVLKQAPKLNITNPANAHENETKEQARERILGPAVTDPFGGGGVVVYSK